jgi:hypothetical protein
MGNGEGKYSMFAFKFLLKNKVRWRNLKEMPELNINIFPSECDFNSSRAHLKNPALGLQEYCLLFVVRTLV